MFPSCAGAASQERGSEVDDGRYGKQDQPDWPAFGATALTSARNTFLSVVSVSA